MNLVNKTKAICRNRVEVLQRLLKKYIFIDAEHLENISIDYFQSKDFFLSRKALLKLKRKGKLNESGYCRLALIHLILNNEKNASRCLQAAASKNTFYLNTDLDIAKDSEIDTPSTQPICSDGLLFSGYNLASMRAYQVGAGYLSNDLAENAHYKQAILRTKVTLTKAQREFLHKYELTLDNIQLFPVPWITQIGHIGMLDIMLRMRALSWWKGDAVVIAPPQLVANHSFLQTITKHHRARLVEVDPKDLLFQELNMLARSHGNYYHSFQPAGMPMMRWHEAAAYAMFQERHNHSSNTQLAESFDKYFESDAEIKGLLNAALENWGIGKNDWYVCLHLREPGFYTESAGDIGQGNRNSALTNYVEAIHFIVENGGRVIKMGAKNSPLPITIPGLIDYPHSPYKSEKLDIALIRHAKMFIGTTSGLANVAISFGLPTAQVNCITTEFQPWHALTRFCLKPIQRKNGAYLTQSELTGDYRWALATAQTMEAAELLAEDNTSDEILETVKEVYELSVNIGRNDDALIEAWRSSLAAPYAYGAAQISHYFLAKHQSHFISHEG